MSRVKLNLRLAERDEAAIRRVNRRLIATGYRSGDATSTEEVNGISSNVNLPVIVGSGLSV